MPSIYLFLKMFFHTFNISSVIKKMQNVLGCVCYSGRMVGDDQNRIKNRLRLIRKRNDFSKFGSHNLGKKKAEYVQCRVHFSNVQVILRSL